MKSTCDELPSLITATETKACLSRCLASVEETSNPSFPRPRQPKKQIASNLKSRTSFSSLLILLNGAKRQVCEEKRAKIPSDIWTSMNEKVMLVVNIKALQGKVWSGLTLMCGWSEGKRF